MTTKFVTVVIPALNEGKVIKYAISRAMEAFSMYKVKGEVLIMDSSTDGGITKAEAEKLGARVISIPKQGLGKAYIDSIPHLHDGYIVMGDADGTYDFMEMDRFIKKLDEGYDFVMGSRLRGNIHPGAMPRKNRYIGTPFLTFFINLFFNAKISDCNSGLRALTLDAFKKMQMESRGWEYASEMVIKAKLCRLKMCETPVSLLADRDGRTPHLPAWSAGWANLRYIMLLASEFLFIKTGTVLTAVGCIILFSQLFGPIVIAGVTFGTFYVFLGLVLAIIGLGVLQMGILTQTFTYLKNFKVSSITKRVQQIYSFEKGLIAGIMAVICGIGLSGWSIVRRYHSGSIEVLDFKIGLYATFLMMFGVQSIYFSFVYYLFSKNH